MRMVWGAKVISGEEKSNILVELLRIGLNELIT